MRISPVVLALINSDYSFDEKLFTLNTLGGVTHAHPISRLGDFIYYLFMNEIIKTKDKNKAFDYIINYDYEKYFDKKNVNVYRYMLNKDFLNLKDIEDNKNGYVVYTLEGVLFSIMNNNDFRSSALCSINLGFDTDTVAAITGSLAGALYGYDSIPKDWIKDLRNKEYLDELIDKFSLKYCVLKNNNK